MTMKNSKREMRNGISILSAVLIFWALSAMGAEAPPKVSWSANAVGGTVVKVPAEKTSVLAFVRAGQEQSGEAMKQIKATVGEAKDVQVVIVLSGQQAEDPERAIAAWGQYAWPVVVDPAYAASGQMGVHVWPTTLVVLKDGTQAAHLAGLAKSFAADLGAYLDFAAKRIDETKLKQRLVARDVVGDSPSQMAGRHLQVAQRLIERGNLDQAKEQLTEGLKLRPEDAGLRVAMARLLLTQKQPKEAMQVLDSVPAGAVPAWQVNLLRASALIQLELWEQAKALLPDAIKLNPNPAEAHYLLGQVYEHEKDFARAAVEYRVAYEGSLAPLEMK